MTRNSHTNLGCLDNAACGLHTGNPVAVTEDTGHLTVLDDVNTVTVGAAGESPGHRIMTGDTGPPPPMHEASPVRSSSATTRAANVCLFIIARPIRPSVMAGTAVQRL